MYEQILQFLGQYGYIFIYVVTTPTSKTTGLILPPLNQHIFITPLIMQATKAVTN
jgi:hypothetical protein